MDFILVITYLFKTSCVGNGVITEYHKEVGSHVEYKEIGYMKRTCNFKHVRKHGSSQIVLTIFLKMVLQPNSENLGTKLLKKHEELQYDTTSVSSNLEAAELLGKKKVSDK